MSETPPPSSREFDLLLAFLNTRFEQIQVSQAAGFQGVNHRLDTLNGQVDAHSRAISTLEERTSTTNGRANGGLLAGAGGLIAFLGNLLWTKLNG
jgi:hypothetical protein